MERGRASAEQKRGPVRVLLIEDDTVDCLAFERHVRQQELAYDWRIATSVAEARELLATESFDVVLTDYHLGDGLGLDVMAAAGDLPVIVITGAGDEEIAVRAMRAGAYDYLIKDTELRYLKVVPAAIENARRHHAAARRARILQQAITSINDSIYITDADGSFLFVNATFCATYGYAEDEVLGRGDEILWAAEGSENELRPRSPAELPAAGERGECRHRRRDDSELEVLLSRSPIVDSGGRCIGAVGATRDISERKRWEKALRSSEERYALAAAGANDGLWDWDLRRDRIYFSDRFKATLGYTDREVGETESAWLSLIHPEDLSRFKAQLEAHLDGLTPHFENEHRIRTAEGEYLWVQSRGLAVRDSEGRVYRMAGSQRDVTDRKKVEEQLTHAALHDALTGLPNRALFMDRLDNAVKRHQRRSDHFFGVIFLDLDRFKVINDSLGHLVGDKLLQGIAHRLQKCLRIGDTVARLGGDEFAILLEDLDDEQEVHQVAERIQRAIQAPFEINEHEFFTAASLGVALSSTGYERAEDLLRDADTAMYRAKAQGRTRQVVFDPSMHTRAVALLHLENDLRRAVERREFAVFYQPILSLYDGRLRGFEALVRWIHPKRGEVSPREFLPLAQETGLSPAIGWWVLEEACRRMQEWRERFSSAAHATVSVNLDAQQLASREVHERVSGALASAGLPASGLELEVTESILLSSPEVTASTLSRLRSDGIELHIDDFGTGYSSLSQLNRFPVDTLKIDRAFVGQIEAGSDRLEIVRAIISLAHNLGLEVMAEGIETQAQLRELRALGCERGQGFLFSRPLAKDDVAVLLAREPLSFAGFPVESPAASVST